MHTSPLSSRLYQPQALYLTFFCLQSLFLAFLTPWAPAVLQTQAHLSPPPTKLPLEWPGVLRDPGPVAPRLVVHIHSPVLGKQSFAALALASRQCLDHTSPRFMLGSPLTSSTSLLKSHSSVTTHSVPQAAPHPHHTAASPAPILPFISLQKHPKHTV